MTSGSEARALTMSRASSSRRPTRRAAMASLTPSRASPAATARPMPREAPVTSAVFPFSCRSIWCSWIRKLSSLRFGDYDRARYIMHALPVSRSGADAGACAVMIMRFGGYQKPASIHNRAAAFFGESLRKSLGDAIEFVLIGSVLDELGRASGQLPDMVARGELSFCYMSTVRFTKAVPPFAILELPYVVKHRAAAYDAFSGAYGDLVKRQLAANSPFRLLGIWDNGFRHLSNRVRPIRSPGDCRGLRIRTQLSAIQGEPSRALGLQPSP